MSKVKTTAGDRLRRVLAIVPWIVANPGVEVSEVAARFGLTEKALINDLNVVWMIGLPPYTPDALVEVVFEEGRVWINYADFFSRPLRLSPAQGLALLASTDGLLSVPGTEPDGPLARALAKMSVSLGVEPEEAVDVDLGDVAAETLDQLRSAIETGTEVDIVYYSYGRDEMTERRIAPWRVSADSGAWYVEAWCHRAEGERIFRVDRIEMLTPTDERTKHDPSTGGPSHDGSGSSVFHPGSSDPTVTLVLAPSAAWVVDTYPCDVLDVGTDGSQTVRLVITALPWLERLLVRLGPSARVVADRDDGPAGLNDLGQVGEAAASRILSRYRD